MTGSIGKTSFVLLGGTMLAILVAWVLSTFAKDSIYAPFVSIAGLGIRGILDDEMPVKEMEATMQSANDIVNQNYLWAHRLSWVSRAFDWLGFGLTSLITIFAGIEGKALATNGNNANPPDPAKVPPDIDTTRRRSRRPKTWVQVIGGMAAISAMCIAISTRLNADYARSVENAEQLLVAIDDARSKFVNAMSPDEGHEVMSTLRKEIERRR